VTDNERRARRRRRVFSFVALLLAASLLLIVKPWAPPHSPMKQLLLFSPDHRVENFRRMEEVFPARRIAASTTPQPWPQGAPVHLPAGFAFAGRTADSHDFLARSVTTGLLVLKDGAIVHESYALGATEASRLTSFSVAKSVVATLVAIALKEGDIRSLDDQAAAYAPELAGTAYGAATLLDLLRMSSGVRFDERYDTQFSDIQRVFQRMFLFGQRIDDITPGYAAEVAPGTRFHYVSIDSQVLSQVLRGATGRSVSDYAREKLFDPLGMEQDALWNLDAVDGDELAFCCLNMTLRDYARLGQLYLQQGVWNGTPLLPDGWVRNATRRDEPWLAPGNGFAERGYALHWWVPVDADNEYFANGIWGQTVWVDEKRGVVIVKTSADPDFRANMAETIAFLRAVSAAVAPAPAAR
jgi:CubicO group peptidase (beta-lactamase class C family)